MTKLEQLQELWGKDYRITVNEHEGKKCVDIQVLTRNGSSSHTLEEKGFYASICTYKELQKISETRKIMGWDNERN